MAETLKDINATLNVGGVLAHMNGVQGGGGELVRYDTTPVGGPPEGNFDANVRAPLTFSLTTRVVGDTAEERETFIAKFPRGKVFACKESPAGDSEMFISGQPDAIGKDFIVMNSTTSHSFQENSELTVEMEEKGPTGAGGGSGSGSG